MSTLSRLVSVRAIFVSVLCPIFVLGQTQTTGKIGGAIRDPQGAVIANAAFQLENTATGEKRTTASDTYGNYALAFLSPGLYELTVSSPGFATGRFSSLRVGTGQIITVNFVLSVASTSFKGNVTPLLVGMPSRHKIALETG
jgi:Carboxypeptidase regulatory-like domain